MRCGSQMSSSVCGMLRPYALCIIDSASTGIEINSTEPFTVVNRCVAISVRISVPSEHAPSRCIMALSDGHSVSSVRANQRCTKQSCTSFDCDHSCDRDQSWYLIGSGQSDRRNRGRLHHLS